MVRMGFLGVLIAALVYVIMGAIWYSPLLFGKIWMREKKIEKENIRNKIFAYIFNIIVAFILAYFLSITEFYFGAASFLDGVAAGFFVYMGFVFPTQILSTIWIKHTFKLFLIDNLYFLLAIMIMGGILVG